MEQLLEFSDVHVLVLGDIMIDEYIFGQTNRISPEAPVPVVQLKSREHRLGGAANVAMNTSSLGAKTTMIGIIGDDFNGRILTSLTNEKKDIKTFFIKDTARKTTCKTRILADNQHLLRVDNEDDYDSDDEVVAKVENMLKYVHHNQKVDILILQDYNKGFFSPSMIKMVMNWSKANAIRTALDPKEKHLELFKGVNIFKPNLKEVKHFLGKEVILNEKGLKDCGTRVLKLMACEVMVLTLSSKGIFIAEKSSHHWESTSAQSIVDVSGAGDTVMGLVALLYSKSIATQEELAQLANYGGAAVCRVPGVAVVDKEMIINVVKKVE